jgi:hypothetical protein
MRSARNLAGQLEALSRLLGSRHNQFDKSGLNRPRRVLAV